MGFFRDMELRKYRYVAPLPASFLLQAIGGLLYAQGVCVAMINRPEYTLSIGIAGFCTCSGMLFAGIFINKMVPRSYAHLSAMYASFIGSLGLCGHICIAIALSINNVPLLYVSAVMYGFGCGVFFISTVDVLQSWMPESPGSIAGFGLLCSSAGSIVGIEGYRTLASSLGSAIAAIAVMGIISILLAFPVSMLLQKPPEGWHPDSCLSLQANETASIVDGGDQWYDSTMGERKALSFRDVVSDLQFYLLTTTYAATVGPGFAVIVGFQSMVMNMFDVEMSWASSAYIGISVLGMATRPLIGMCADRIGDQFSTWPRLSGVKRTTQLLLLVQLLATICMPYFVRNGILYGFVAACAVLYMTCTGGAVVIACLSGTVYNQRNACLIYSLIGFSAGASDLFFSWTVSKGNRAAAAGHISNLHKLKWQANDYSMFLWCSIALSAAGLFASYHIGKCRKVLSPSSRCGAMGA